MGKEEFHLVGEFRKDLTKEVAFEMGPGGCEDV